MVSTTHLMLVGGTTSGKTRYGNDLHRTFPKVWRGSREVGGVSIFIDTKGGDKLWGYRIRDLDQIHMVLPRARKIIWDPPRTVTGIDWPLATAQLTRLWGRIQARGRQLGWSNADPPWIQVVLDEAQRWEQNSDMALLEDMVATGFGMGLRLVYVTQHPKGLSTTARTNLAARVVFHQGDEGRRCIQSWGWPVADIDRHTANRFHFASYHPQLGWRYHPPRPG